MFSQEDVTRIGTSEKRQGLGQGIKEERKAWLETLEVESLDEARAALADYRQIKPKAVKSEAQQATEKVKAEYEAKLQASEQARVAAEQKAESEKIRSFLTGIVADTNDPQLALVLFGLPYEAEEKLTIKDGQFLIVSKDGTEHPRKDPEKWAREILSKREYLAKPEVSGSGTRVMPAKSEEAPKRRAPRSPSEMLSTVTSMLAEASGTRSPR